MTGKEIERNGSKSAPMLPGVGSAGPSVIDEKTGRAIQDNAVLSERISPESPIIFLDIRYSGNPLEFNAGGKTRTLRRKDMLGFINSRRNSQFSMELVERLLERKRQGDTPKKIFDELGNQLPPSYEGLCKLGDNDRSEVGFLMLVHVDPDLRGLNLSQRLLRRTLQIMRDRFNLEYVAFYGRVPGLSEEFTSPADAEKHLQEYVARKRPDGFHPDWAVRFHQYAGCEVICGIPNSAVDNESLNHGFVGVYDLIKLRGEGRI